MELRIIGSSSAGNAYLLDNGNESLLIECGCRWASILKRADFAVSRIRGAIISHEHGDHAGAIKNAVKSQINVFSSKGTFDALQMPESRLVHPVTALDTFQVGGFRIMPFDVQHDAAEPFGFLIHHAETGFILFATDTYYLKYTFPGLNNIMIECNYEQSLLDANVASGIVSSAQQRRTMRSHMSFETCRRTLLANDLTDVNNIVLIHLSPQNSHAATFRRDIAAATGKNVFVAEPNENIIFNKTPI